MQWKAEGTKGGEGARNVEELEWLIYFIKPVPAAKPFIGVEVDIEVLQTVTTQILESILLV